MASLFVLIDNSGTRGPLDWMAFANSVREVIDSCGAEEIVDLFSAPVANRRGFLVEIADTEVDDLYAAVDQVALGFGSNASFYEDQDCIGMSDDA